MDYRIDPPQILWLNDEILLIMLLQNFIKASWYSKSYSLASHQIKGFLPTLISIL